MARYPGRKGLVYISTSAGGVATAVIALNKWAMNRTTDKIDVTSFLDLNKTYVQGLPDVQITFSGVWDDTETKPFAAASSTTPVNMYLYPSQDALSKFAGGTAWMDCSIDVDVKGAVTIQGTAAAASSWAITL